MCNDKPPTIRIGPPKKAKDWSNRKLKEWYYFRFGKLPEDWRQFGKVPVNELKVRWFHVQKKEV